MNQEIMSIFTRTPLHVGAGNSVGAIDSPIQRERHTAFPVIPASTIKGVLSDEVNETEEKEGQKNQRIKRSMDGIWLFGAEESENACAGAVMIGEAKILAFPVRSARNSFAWITSPLIIRRAINDGLLSGSDADFPDLPDDKNVLIPANSQITIDKKNVVLEEYALEVLAKSFPSITEALSKMLSGQDKIWNKTSIESRLAIVSDGMMSYFVQASCEIAQHVRIDDVTGTAKKGGLFNQENIPSETMFYSPVSFTAERCKDMKERRTPEAALKKFQKILGKGIFQFGGNASTGLGYCSVALLEKNKGE